MRQAVHSRCEFQDRGQHRVSTRCKIAAIQRIDNLTTQDRPRPSRRASPSRPVLSYGWRAGAAKAPGTQRSLARSPTMVTRTKKLALLLRCAADAGLAGDVEAP